MESSRHNHYLNNLNDAISISILCVYLASTWQFFKSKDFHRCDVPLVIVKKKRKLLVIIFNWKHWIYFFLSLIYLFLISLLFNCIYSTLTNPWWYFMKSKIKIFITQKMTLLVSLKWSYSLLSPLATAGVILLFILLFSFLTTGLDGGPVYL